MKPALAHALLFAAVGAIVVWGCRMGAARNKNERWTRYTRQSRVLIENCTDCGGTHEWVAILKEGKHFFVTIPCTGQRVYGHKPSA